MQICIQILTKVEAIVFMFISIVEEIVKTVCSWVSSIITTIIEVTKKVCKWLPWPLNKLCDWVTELVEVVKTVWDWVCEEIVIRLIRWIRIAVRYIFYILRWVCWIIDWIPRFLFELLPCLLGASYTKRIPVCIKVLVDADGTPVVPVDRVNELLDAARERFEQCDLELCVASMTFVTAPDDIEEFTCDASGFFSKHHLWFEDNSCSADEVGATALTIFFVPDYEGSKGCAMSRTNYIVVGADASLATVAHEIGHQADLTHRDTPTNVMMDGTTDASVDFTPWQCCMIRSARFATAFPLLSCRFESVDIRLTRESPTRPDRLT